MKRRSLLTVGAAGAALVAGAGTAVWRELRPGPPSRSAEVWDQSFESLNGAVLPMASLRGRPLLLNFWATWCLPCVTEMPLLDAFALAHAAAGWQVLALAIDKRESVHEFVSQRKLSLPVALAATIGIELSRSLGNSLGALPFTAVFASSGANVATRLGALSQETLSQWRASVS